MATAGGIAEWPPPPNKTLADLSTDHPYPRIQRVRVSRITRDPAISPHPLDEDRIEKLRAKFVPHLMSLPMVSIRETGQIVVLNGSHRCEMLRRD